MSDLFRERESDVEHKIVRYAKHKGWRHHKFVSPGRRGKTDQFFTKSHRQIIFMEIKRDEDEEPSEIQKREQQRLRDEGFSVFTVYSYEEACAIFDTL